MRTERKKTKFNVILSSWLIGLTILLTAYLKLFEATPLVMVVCCALSIVSLLLIIKDLSNEQLINLRNVIFCMIGLWLWCVCIAFLQGADKPLRLEVLERLIYTFLLSFIFCNVKIILLPLKVVLYLIIVYFYYQYFILGVTSYGVNDAESGAVNTVILLTISISIQILDYRDNNRVALVPSLLIVPIAIMSWNRTGFIVSVVYVLATSFWGVGLTRNKKRRFFLYILLSVILVYLVVRYMSWFSETSLFAKFEKNSIDNSARSSIWVSYFYDFGLIELFFGRPIDPSHPLIAGFLNPHNSFIMLHSLTGIFALVVIGVTINRLWNYFKYNKFMLLLFLVLIVRSNFDMVFFFQPFDYAFYLFIVDYKELIVKHEDIRVRII